MSLRSKKSSAFSVFRNKKGGAYNIPDEEVKSSRLKTKASSAPDLSNQPVQDEKPPKPEKPKMRIFSTPTLRKSKNDDSSKKSSGKKKLEKVEKAEFKRIKKALKDAERKGSFSKMNTRAFLPDSALQSPLSSINGSLKKRVTFNDESGIVGNKPRSRPPITAVFPDAENGFDETDDVTNDAPERPPRPGSKHNLAENAKEAPPIPPKKRRRSNEKREGDGDTSTMTLTDLEPLPKSGAPYMYDSTHEAKKLFECMIHPVKVDKFFSELWEQKPLLVKRHMKSYNDGWFSTAELEKILKEEDIQFGRNIDVTTYTNGKRETHNPHGKAYAPIVWDYYQNGCSVRFLNPQTYSRNVWKLLSTLQEYFGSCVGANIYLTPPGSQGFAPHWDDIEAFILQLEGRKHWRLYSPRSDNENLPRESSGNFQDTDLGESILDIELEAGDLLYFPRGIIHQADTPNDTHSLHITVSTYQKNSWGDLLQTLVPRALSIAMEEDVEFRKGLPRDYLNYMGIANADSEHPERKAFLRKMETLMSKLLSHAPVDSACDQMGRRFIHESLPPVLTEGEKSCSIQGNGDRWDEERHTIVNSVELEPDTPVKIIRKGALRLVSEEENVLIYHTLENARVHHGAEPQMIEITPEVAPAVEYLIQTYPEYTTIDNLPCNTLQEKMDISSLLYDKGLIITEDPLVPDDEVSDIEGD
ncbi:unnamed protein product [Owenia fusiformis]|uniref:Bifunctional lysine-specific demethylase and histidyl-hydroxylase n=1 Tax=Owenia fusiformis TaxID=6347 RepID=A0A8S4PD92_OWEFU|nr:unnamed protein product [Owenia fusiformis]